MVLQMTIDGDVRLQKLQVLLAVRRKLEGLSSYKKGLAH